jgi:hypothetical protein
MKVFEQLKHANLFMQFAQDSSQSNYFEKDKINYTFA